MWLQLLTWRWYIWLKAVSLKTMKFDYKWVKFWISQRKRTLLHVSVIELTRKQTRKLAVPRNGSQSTLMGVYGRNAKQWSARCGTCDRVVVRTGWRVWKFAERKCMVRNRRSEREKGSIKWFCLQIPLAGEDSQLGPIVSASIFLFIHQLDRLWTERSLTLTTLHVSDAT